jgi:hypothetical protein
VALSVGGLPGRLPPLLLCYLMEASVVTRTYVSVMFSCNWRSVIVVATTILRLTGAGRASVLERAAGRGTARSRPRGRTTGRWPRVKRASRVGLVAVGVEGRGLRHRESMTLLGGDLTDGTDACSSLVDLPALPFTASTGRKPAGAASNG